MNIESLMHVCSWLGVLVVAGCTVMIVYYAFDAIRNTIHVLRWTYKYKHRFDKPPTAACYCKDCVYHVEKCSDGMGPCGWPGVSRWTPDNGFCYEAEPMTMKEATRRGKDDRR